MRAPVCHQVGVPTEALATLLTLVGLLTGITIAIRGQALLTALGGPGFLLTGFLWETGVGWGWFWLSLLQGTGLPIIFG